ncbi:MAG: precorrin-2 dehydrogenase/sirohydrochlorin ferrochelatase [Saprospiraceae bacterium]|jgi:precorrin-2 dehydrogenase/sirohydrochlorin ferrochelatase
MNTLYPIFLKLHKLNLLIVGAGYVGYEKLHFILKNSPDANITVVAKEVSKEVQALLSKGNYKVKIIKKAFDDNDLIKNDLIIAATDIQELNIEIHTLAKRRGKLVNVADTPELCDFYLGSIVTRGDLKVAISTNGKSPTFAKRFRQVLEEVLPPDTNELLKNLKIIRDRLTGNFSEKVKALNEITASLVEKAD